MALKGQLLFLIFYVIRKKHIRFVVYIRTSVDLSKCGKSDGSTERKSLNNGAFGDGMQVWIIEEWKDIEGRQNVSGSDRIYRDILWMGINRIRVKCKDYIIVYKFLCAKVLIESE